MESNDGFPTNIEFEIDRQSLRRYWRLQGIIGCCIPGVLFSMLFAVAFYSAFLESKPEIRLAAIVGWFVAFLVGAIIAGLVAGTILYFAICHWPSELAARNLRVMVEGPYLRIISGSAFLTDRRIHFRAISDYSTHEGPLLKKLGMKSVSFRIIGSQPSSQQLPGLINPDQVRDTLCKIDAAREI